MVLLRETHFKQQFLLEHYRDIEIFNIKVLCYVDVNWKSFLKYDYNTLYMLLISNVYK